MNNGRSFLANVANTVIICTIVSVLVGLIFYKGRIFNIHSGTFQFVGSAIIISIFFAFLKFSTRRNAILVLFILLIIKQSLDANFSAFWLTKNILYFALLGASVYIYYQLFLPRLNFIPFGKFLVFPSIYIITDLLRFLISIPIFRVIQRDLFAPYSMSEVGFNFILSFGIGLGLELSQTFTAAFAGSIAKLTVSVNQPD